MRFGRTGRRAYYEIKQGFYEDVEERIKSMMKQRIADRLKKGTVKEKASQTPSPKLTAISTQTDVGKGRKPNTVCQPELYLQPYRKTWR